MEKSLSILFGILLISNSAIAQSVQVNSGTTENLASIVFTDSLNAYCVGTNGIILHSSDAGENWVKQNYEDSITFVSIEAFNTDSLIALGFDNRNSKIVLCTTENAGNNWHLLKTDFKIHNYFPSRKIVVTDSYAFFNVKDSLYKYDFSKFELIGTGIHAFDFINDSIGIKLIFDKYYQVHSTSNLGQKWDSLSTPGKAGIPNNIIHGMQMETSDKLCIWYNYSTGLTCTSDSGVSWQTFDQTILINDMHLSGNNLVALGETGEYYYSYDFGYNWSEIKIDSLNNRTLWSVDFFNNLKALICGENGLILKTSNAGVGIKDEEKWKKSIKIYPNPSTDNIIIELNSKINIISIHLIDNQGRRVKKFKSSLRSLDISGISAGIYFLQITTEKGALNKKLIVE